MNEQEQREVIAKACEWKSQATPFERHGTRISGAAVAWWHKDVPGCHLSPPDYSRDLNAMRQAVQSLSDGERGQFVNRLADMFNGSEKGKLRRAIIHATAAQWAKAFLQVKGLWKETPPPTLRCPRCDAEIDSASVDDGWTGCPSCKWDGPVEEANKA